MAAGGPGTAVAETIVIKGSTTVLPIAQAALEAYMKANPGRRSRFPEGGRARDQGADRSIDGHRHLVAGDQGSEIALAKSKGCQPDGRHRGDRCDRAHRQPEKPVRDLTIDQLSQIYQGKIATERGGRR